MDSKWQSIATGLAQYPLPSMRRRISRRNLAISLPSASPANCFGASADAEVEFVRRHRWIARDPEPAAPHCQVRVRGEDHTRRHRQGARMAEGTVQESAGHLGSRACVRCGRARRIVGHQVMMSEGRRLARHAVDCTPARQGQASRGRHHRRHEQAAAAGPDAPAHRATLLIHPPRAGRPCVTAGAASA
jgi:hypothetical protein